jgi:hypothetical protein
MQSTPAITGIASLAPMDDPEELDIPVSMTVLMEDVVTTMEDATATMENA